MKVGDKRQAVILSAVAVLAVGFLVSQLKGKASAGVASEPNASASATATTSRPVSAPVKVLGDPFSNPALGRLISNDKGKPDTPPPKRPTGTRYGGGFGPWHIPMAYPMDGAIGDASPDSEQGTTQESTQSNRSEAGPPKSKSTEIEATRPTVVLNAIVSAGHPIALISVNGAANRQFSAGQTIAQGIQIRSIGDDAISLSVAGHKGLVTLTVGSKF